MSDELMRYVTGEAKPRKEDKAAVARARQIYEQTRVAAYKVDATIALGGHIMEGVLGLDARRQQLAQGDPGTNALLMDVEAETIRQVKKVQGSMFDPFGL